MAQASKSTNRFNFQHGLVLLVGLLVFVLLILANKTHLESRKESAFETSDSNEAPTSTSETPVPSAVDELLGLIPASTTDPSIDSLRALLPTVQGPSDRALVYQSIVQAYKDRGQIDHAAVYAGALADEQPEPRHLIVAGALFRNALYLPHFQADSSLYTRFSDQALRHLRKAEELEPRSEDVLMELGLAMVESRRTEYSMEGILKIRTVTEINPRNTEALYQLGVFSMDTHQYDKAEGRFRQVLEVEPGNFSAQFLLALACQQQGKVAEFKQLMTAVAAQTQDLQLAERAKSLLNQP